MLSLPQRIAAANLATNFALTLYILRITDHFIDMNSLFIILMAIAMFATVIVLVTGIAVMVKGGEFNKQYGGKLMNARVVLQGIALLFLALAILTKN